MKYWGFTPPGYIDKEIMKVKVCGKKIVPFATLQERLCDHVASLVFVLRTSMETQIYVVTYF